MIWKEVITRYGIENAEKMKNSKYLQGCTCLIKDGEVDFFDDDIKLAYRDITGQRIHPIRWD